MNKEKTNLYSEFKDSSETLREKRKRIGSQTAKNGFKNEIDICEKFNNWEKDKDAKEWLEIMNYDIKNLDKVEAIQIPLRINKKDFYTFNIDEIDYNKFVRFKKSDAQIKLIIKVGGIVKYEYISIKKANSDADYNQIDKRTVESYQEMWCFDDEIKKWLKLFSGETIPNKKIFKKIKDKRRMFLIEMPIDIQKKIRKFFEENKILIISDIIKGRGGLSAGWMLVTKLIKEQNKFEWVLKDINTTMNFFGKGEVVISKRGSLHIGKITMQRKGGTPDPTKIQFKINPCQLFEIR